MKCKYLDIKAIKLIFFFFIAFSFNSYSQKITIPGYRAAFLRQFKNRFFNFTNLKNAQK